MTQTPNNYNAMVAGGLDRWFTVISRTDGRSVLVDGRRVAFATKPEAIKFAKSLDWANYTWAPDGR